LAVATRGHDSGPHRTRGAMANIVVVGVQWGDEGKGKIVDFLSERFDVVARYQGGNNAGHTVVVGDDKIVLHLIPSGVLRKGKVCVLGNGVVIDLGELIQEMDQLERLHVKFEDHFFISRRAHLVLPYHKLLDVAHEQRATKKIGTTGRGIGPAYVDKMARVGIRVGDLHHPSLFRERLSQNVAEKRAQYPESRALASLEPDRILHDHLKYYERIRSYLADSSLVLDRLMREGKQVLFEGAQGTLLDVDLGTYPYVTSSSATAGGACTGTGVSPKRIGGVLGICKAYTTRVGEGPFPTELSDAIGERIRERGAEFGATTGRPRRTGWFDAVAVRYAARVNGLDALALMKLDVLDGLETIQVCTGYRYQGELVTDFPNETDILADCQPVYEAHPGWNESTVGVVEEAKLPPACQAYLRRLEELAGVPLALLSTGPRRDQTIVRSRELWKGWGIA
jgi:adenylosuccinate synthase